MKTKTSLEAFKNMQPKIPNDHQVILSVLSEDFSLTYKEIAKAIRLKTWQDGNNKLSLNWGDNNKVSRRMLELVKLKKVEITGTRICSIAKSKCTTYKLTTKK